MQTAIPLQKIVDKYLGGLLLGCLALVQRQQRHRPQPRSVLFIKLWAMGESVLTLPAIHAIRQTFPEATISVLVRKNNAAVFRYNKDIQEIVLCEPSSILALIRRFRKYDIAIDAEPFLNLSSLLGWWFARWRVGFANGIRARLYSERQRYEGKRHVVLEYLSLVGLVTGRPHTCDRLIPLGFSPEDAAYVQSALLSLLDTKIPVVAIAPGSGNTGVERRWPAASYHQLLQLILEHTPAQVLLLGGPAENAVCNEVIGEKQSPRVQNISGKTTISQLFALLRYCKLFIGNDSGPMHAAAAQGTQTVGIFGPNLPLRFAPYGSGNIAFYHRLSCSPCINVHRGSIPPCYNIVKGDCVRHISPEVVFQTIRPMLLS